MNIEGLKLFREVASRGSISKVAESTHFSQPAISQQIKRLEESIGYELFFRSNKGVQLTEAGNIVHKYAKSIVRSHENMLEDLSMIEDNFQVIRLNCTPIISTYALPCTVYSINNSSKSINADPLKLEHYSNHSDEVETNVINDTFDLGIIISKPKSSALSYDLLATDHLIPVATGRNKLDGEISIDAILNEELILPGENFRIKDQIKKWFSDHGVNIDEFTTSPGMNEIESIKATVEKGFGISFLPYLTIKKELYTKQLKKLDLKGFDITYEIYLVYKESRLNDIKYRDFIKMFKSSARKTFC